MQPGQRRKGRQAPSPPRVTLTPLKTHHIFSGLNEPKDMAMKWKTLVVVEIAVGLEVNAYACAEVK